MRISVEVLNKMLVKNTRVKEYYIQGFIAGMQVYFTLRTVAY